MVTIILIIIVVIFIRGIAVAIGSCLPPLVLVPAPPLLFFSRFFVVGGDAGCVSSRLRVRKPLAGNGVRLYDVLSLLCVSYLISLSCGFRGVFCIFLAHCGVERLHTEP